MKFWTLKENFVELLLRKTAFHIVGLVLSYQSAKLTEIWKASLYFHSVDSYFNFALECDKVSLQNQNKFLDFLKSKMSILINCKKSFSLKHFPENCEMIKSTHLIL